MHTSTDRILTTHVGSLPRPKDVVDFLFAQNRGESFDAEQFDAALQRAVGDAVGRQAEAGIDLVSDGEMSEISYASYIYEGPHTRDIPLATVLSVLVKAKPMALLIEGARLATMKLW